MANRNNGRRGRSRKRRRSDVKAAAATGAADVQAGSAESGAEHASGHSDALAKRPAGERARSRGAAPRGSGEGGFKDPQSMGERPQAPWYPLPLSELLILVGAIGTVVGLQKGVSNGGPALVAGLAAVVIGTLEVTLREHLSGYRSHTLILSLLPTILFDTAVALIVAAFVTPVPVAARVAVLVLDVPLFAFLFKVLRARFAEARRERVFAGSR